MDQLRKLHNDCKRKLILNWVPPGSHVLDCGCGRGGDLHKWNSIPRLKVSAIDPDEDSLAEAQNRAFESQYGVWFLPPGDIVTAKDWAPYDVVCYNFSIHYIAENKNIYDRSIDALGQCLASGGRLIGIVPDSTRIISILNSKPKYTDRLGNTLELKNGRLSVYIADGPFYAQGEREEPILDRDTFIDSLKSQGFRMILWEPMLKTPNGLISDIYSQFVFVKQ